MKKNKKMTLVASALAVSGVLAGMVIATNGVSAIIAEENTHVHGDNCIIHHYAAISPTASKAGVKEYWICCNDPNHSISFEAPTTGQITDATHTSDFTVTADDPRYIAPYTFPEVFSTPWAYDTAVTVEEGKVKSLTNKIHIKGSVLKEAYELGYTHFKLHSVGSGEDATQVLGNQDQWQNYYKRYANDNDNRFWLKSFNDKSQGLKIASLTTEGADAKGSITLSDFELFKSSVTESWGNGAMTDYGSLSNANKYIAYENGELVFDNAGGGEYSQIGEIPTSIMGENEVGSGTRMIAVKNLAEGVKGANKKIIVNNKDKKAAGYTFRFDAKESITNDGFYRPWYAEWFSTPGLVNDQSTPGALSLGLEHPGAIAIRINYDFTVGWAESGVTKYEQTPLANTIDNSKMRFAFTDMNFASSGNQMNVVLPNSVDHKGINVTMTSTAKPAEGENGFVVNNKNISKYYTTPKFEKEGDVYKASLNITFADAGVSFILRFAEAAENGSFTFEYSWID